MGFLRWGWPRRYIIKLSCWLWPRKNTPEWLLDFLYPDACVLTFPSSNAKPTEAEPHAGGKA